LAFNNVTYNIHTNVLLFDCVNITRKLCYRKDDRAMRAI